MSTGWGRVDPSLLGDPARHAAYTRAHHVAAHHWATWRLDVPMGPAGLALGLSRSVEADAAPEVEATAILVEALAVEYARDLYRRADFGLTALDVDWDWVQAGVRDRARVARDRGCGRWARAAYRYVVRWPWLERNARYALSQWQQIAALADAVGHGQVLEPDEVRTVLGEW